MKKFHAVLACAAAAMFALTGCGSSGTPPSAGSPSGTAESGSLTVSARAVTGVGTVLVTSTGRTLYFTEQENAGTIRCTDECARIWAPLTVSSGTPTADAAISARIATVSRPDGLSQVTFDGKPLYTFSLDTAAGEVKGDGAHDSFAGTAFDWHVATTTGSLPKSPDDKGTDY
jgi:predicted lipoprotein with Yx(FWY)xxD motif